MALCSIIRRCRSWQSRPPGSKEDAENIDGMTLFAPHTHPYRSAVRPLASTIVCKKGDAAVFEGRALDNGTDLDNAPKETVSFRKLGYQCARKRKGPCRQRRRGSAYTGEETFCLYLLQSDGENAIIQIVYVLSDSGRAPLF